MFKIRLWKDTKMAIKGLTDRQASFPQIGILRKGAPKPERGPGRDLDYFRFDTDDEAARAMFHQVYGNEPRHINCYLPFSTAEENFFTAKEEWKSGGLVHRCDGEICSIWQTKDGSYSHELKPCPGGCSPVGRLKIIVPELRRFAYVTVQTTSINDIMTLQENLMAAEMVRHGDLRGIPFVLSRRPRQVSTPGQNGKRVRREKWLLSIEPAPAWVGLQLDQMKAEALGRGDLLELEAGDDDPLDLIETEEDETMSNVLAEIEQLRADLAERAASENGNNGKLATANQTGLIASKLEEVFAGDEDATKKRRSVIRALFGVESTKDLTFAQARALLKWLISEHDQETGDYYLSPDALRLAPEIVRLALTEAGQMSFLPDEPEKAHHDYDE